MHIEQVRFDRIFDVQQRTGDFSFESGGWPVYGVNAVGGEIPREAATYAVAFAERGNWETVIGWRDLATQEVRLKPTVWAHLGPHMPWIYLFISGLLGSAMSGGGWKAALPLAAMLVLVAGLLIRSAMVQQRRAELALRAEPLAGVEERA